MGELRVEIKGWVKGESEKAIQFKPDIRRHLGNGTDILIDRAGTAWWPKSQIEIADGAIRVPEWLLKSKASAGVSRELSKPLSACKR